MINQRQSRALAQNPTCTDNRTGHCVRRLIYYLGVEEEDDPLALVVVRADIDNVAVDHRLSLEPRCRLHDVGGGSGVAACTHKGGGRGAEVIGDGCSAGEIGLWVMAC